LILNNSNPGLQGVDYSQLFENIQGYPGLNPVDDILGLNAQKNTAGRFDTALP